MPFTKAVIWLDQADALPRRLDIEEESGARRTLDLSHLRVNQTIPDETFSFKVPKGVRIVDQ
jgi:outer membrane lipoprotein-sorting protein